MANLTKAGLISSVIIAASTMGACSTTSGVKTSASNPAPISFKVGSPNEASRQMASLTPAVPRSYMTTPQASPQPAPEYLAPLPQTLAPAAPAPMFTAPAPQETFDARNVDQQLYMHQKVGRAYKIKGVKYTPKHNPSYDETGIASWYGPNFHGKLTANGETYDKHGLTAAHKTLPLNSMVFVTNMENGKTITLRLNDRGPFVQGRIIDLSYGAAKKLGVSGLAKVRVQYAGPADPMNSAPKLPKAQQPEIVADLPPVVVAPSLPAPEMPAPQTATLTPHAPQAYQPLSVVPHGAALDVPQSSAPAPVMQMPAPAAPIYVAPNKPFTPRATGKTRPRQTFTPPVDGGVMTMTITGPIHLASTGGALPYNSAPIAPTGQYVQAATFSSEARAKSVSQTLSAAGPVNLTQISRNGKTLHRVIVGPYDSQASARNALALVAKLGYSDAKIVKLD